MLALSQLLKRSRSPMKSSVPVFDFSTTALKGQYKNHYVKIVDNVFTPEECASLIALAESDADWEQAAVHYGIKPDQKVIDTDYRNSERILRFDDEAANWIFERLKPIVCDLEEVGPGDRWEEIFGAKGRMKKNWKMVGLNERLSFLKYGSGHYFQGHCDGQLELPDGRKSRVTVQIYLNDEGLEGGATRIWGKRQESWYDVEPKMGRVLIFQQKTLWHSGEEVTEGFKFAVRSDIMFRDEAAGA